VLNIFRLGIGIWGVIASRRTAAQALFYARVTAIICFVLLAFGCVPNLDVVFGLMPLYSNDLWLHLLLAVVAGYFGWVNRSPVES
jgi:hypothetical protein